MQRIMHRPKDWSNEKTQYVKPSRKHMFFETLADTTLSFFNDSTLHGFRNLMATMREPNETRHQRLFRGIGIVVWSMSLILGLAFAVVLMYLVWYKFQTTPTMTTVESNNFPIGNLNFPAVTICNNNKVWEPATTNLTDKLMAKGIPKPRILLFYSELTKLVNPEPINDTFGDVHGALQAINYTIEHLMYEVMQPCSMMMESCAWLGKKLPCHTLFRVATSEEGFCCSFNYHAPLDPDVIDIEHDYIEESENDEVYRVYGAGQFVGLDALIHVDQSEYLAYSHSYYGVAILVHGTQKFPEISDTTAIGQPGQDVTVAVIPTLVVSDPSVRSLPIPQRNCLFEDEIQLRTTDSYTYDLCISECAVRTIYRICSCLPFFYAEVHLRGESYRQCTLRDVTCLKDNRYIFSSLQPDGLNETVGMTCHECLPSCSSQSLKVQTITAQRSDTNPIPSHNHPKVNMSNYVTFRVHFKDVSCIKYRRDVVLSWDGLLASFGGIFGLCVGGSVISIIEVVYFFTLRLCSRLFEYSDRKKLAQKRSVLLGNMRYLGEITHGQMYPRMVPTIKVNTIHNPDKYGSYIH